ncbi:MAG: DUF190 domain-containing protein [Spirochaetaceae bacterium]|nr:DUF190 domain-containing protein [Spirochaetaceae bacterium]
MEDNTKYQLLKIYISEDTRYKSHNLYNALVFKLKELEIVGVTVTRGIAGYGQNKVIYTARFVEMSSSLPIIIEVVDTKDNIDRVIPEIKEMVKEGLITVEDINVIHRTNK